MKKYRQAKERDSKVNHYAGVIRRIRDNGSLDKIKKAQILKGKITTTPMFPQRLIEVNAFKQLDSILYHEPHKKLQARVQQIREVKDLIDREGRAPTNAEVKQIAKYHEQMMVQVNNAIDAVYEQNKGVRKPTSIEKGRIALECIRMQEEPENFMMHNRYLEMAPQIVEDYTSSDEEVIHYDWTPFKYRKVHVLSNKDLLKMGINPSNMSAIDARDRASIEEEQELTMQKMRSSMQLKQQSQQSPESKKSRKHKKLSRKDQSPPRLQRHQSNDSEQPSKFKSLKKSTSVSPKHEQEQNMQSPFTSRKLLLQINTGKEKRSGSQKSHRSGKKSKLTQHLKESAEDEGSSEVSQQGGGLIHTRTRNVSQILNTTPITMVNSPQLSSKSMLKKQTTTEDGTSKVNQKVVFDNKMILLHSDFAESSVVVKAPSELPLIKGSGKFSYAQPIQPKPRESNKDETTSHYRAMSSIQYQESDYENGGIVDFKFPELSQRRNSTIISGMISHRGKKSPLQRKLSPTMINPSNLFSSANIADIANNFGVKRNKSTMRGGQSRNFEGSFTTKRMSAGGGGASELDRFRARNNSVMIMMKQKRDSRATNDFFDISMQSQNQQTPYLTDSRLENRQDLQKRQQDSRMSNWQKQAMMQEMHSMARQASVSRLKQVMEAKQARKQQRKVSTTLNDDLKLIGGSADPKWSFLMDTVQDKRHFYEVALRKVSRDASSELGYLDTRKSPSFQRPPDRVEESSKFSEQKMSVFERLQSRLEKSKAPTDLDILLDNKLGTYVQELLEKDPIKNLVRQSKSREQRWLQADESDRRHNKTLDYVDEENTIDKIVYRKR